MNEAEGWVQGLDPTVLQNAQNQAKLALEQWLAQHPGATVGEVIGGRKVVIRQMTELSAGLPYTTATRGASYGQVPDQLRHFILFAFGTDLFARERVYA